MTSTETSTTETSSAINPIVSPPETSAVTATVSDTETSEVDPAMTTVERTDQTTPEVTTTRSGSTTMTVAATWGITATFISLKKVFGSVSTLALPFNDTVIATQSSFYRITSFKSNTFTHYNSSQPKTYVQGEKTNHHHIIA